MNQNKMTNLIKFLCAILVIFSHAFSLAQNISDPLYRFTNGVVDFGGIAVSIFFFFSGYYITKSILKKGSKHFFRKRFARLLPSLVFVIFLTVFLLGPIFTNLKPQYFLSKHTYLYLLNCLFIPIHTLPGVFTNNIYGATMNGALWTLVVEVLSYLFLFLIYKFQFLNKKKYPYVYVLFLLLGCIANKVFRVLNVPLLCAIIRPFSIFLTAIFISLFEKKVFIRSERLLVAIFLFFLLFVSKNVFGIYLGMIFVLPYILFSIITIFKSIKTNLGFLDNISYQIYLVAFPIQQMFVFLHGGSMKIGLNFIYSSFCAILLAYGLFMVEAKLLEMKVMKRIFD